MIRLITQFETADAALGMVEDCLNAGQPCIVAAPAHLAPEIHGLLRLANVSALRLEDAGDPAYALANLSALRASVVVVDANAPALRALAKAAHPYVRMGASSNDERLEWAEARFREHWPVIAAGAGAVTLSELKDAVAALELPSPTALDASMARVRWAGKRRR